MFTMVVCSICNRRNKFTTVDIEPSPYLSYRENGMGNQELTIQGHWQHWPHKKQNEDNKNTSTITSSITTTHNNNNNINTTHKNKKMSNTNPIKNRG